MYKQFLSITVLIILFSTTLTAFAQDDGLSADEQALLEVILAANTQMTTLESYQVVNEQKMTQNLDAEEGPVQEMTITATSQVRPLDNAIYTSQETKMGMSAEGEEEMNISMQQEIVLVDGEMYLRVDGTGELFETFTALYPYPEDWVNYRDYLINETGYSPEMIDQQFETLTVANFYDTNSQSWQYLNADNVTSIVELPSETLEGKPMRVFQLEIDSQALQNSVVAAQMQDADILNTAFSLAFQNLFSQIFNNLEMETTYNLILWIGVEDNYIYQAQYQMTNTMKFGEETETLALSQTADGSIIYSRFNEPFVIEAPIE